MAYLTGVCVDGERHGQRYLLSKAVHEAVSERASVSRASGVYPFNTACLPLSHSGDPGVNGVSDSQGLVSMETARSLARSGS